MAAPINYATLQNRTSPRTPESAFQHFQPLATRGGGRVLADSTTCSSKACCARHPRSCVAPTPVWTPTPVWMPPPRRGPVHVLFVSKHPDRGASLVRGTQVVAAWHGAAMIGSKQADEACQMLLGGTQAGYSREACVTRSRELLVVHLKDITGSLFRTLPLSTHVLDPVDKIYHGAKPFAIPSDKRLCGLVTHSEAQADLYLGKGARRAWVVPDHGLPGCAADAGSDDDGGSNVFARRAVLVLGGAPSGPLRAALASWASAAARPVRLLFEKDLRANISFAAAEGWEGWLCALLRHNASVAVAWDQISGLAYEQGCKEHMGLSRDACFRLKPSERFVVPLSAGVPTIGFGGYPSFREATNSRARSIGGRGAAALAANVGGARATHTHAAGATAAESLLLTTTLTGLVARLSALTANLTHWRAARRHGRRIAAAHSLGAVVGAYERVRTAAMSQCALRAEPRAVRLRGQR